MTKSFDLLIIGSGPGGYVAAVRAAQLGLSVAIVEKEALGGVCLNWGCIPTKALLRAAEMRTMATHAADFGIEMTVGKVDFTKVIGRSRGVADKLSGGISYLMKKNKVEVIKGTAKLTGLTTADVDGQTVEFKYAMLATGARAKQIPGVLEASANVWTAKEAMTPTDLPESLLVVGGGAIGVEFASFYNAFGTKVTLVEMQDRITPAEDAEISKLLLKALEKKGMTILTQAKLEGLKDDGKQVSATINGEKKTFAKALLAIGVVGNTEGLGLEDLAALAKLQGGPEALKDKGMVKVNKATYQTAIDNIYAIGDVIGAPWLAHVASHEGVIAAEHIAFKMDKTAHAPHAMRYDNIPGCTYCTPQVASTGFTEQAAKDAGRTVKVGRFNYQANGKAIAMGEAEGLVKTIFDASTGELLGAHIIGAEATEMITTFVLGRSMEATESDIIHACLPHPTLSEMIGESVLDSEGRALNA